MPAFYIVFIKVHLCTAINRGRFRILVHVIYVRSNKMHLWENLRCTFVGEPLNHIHQDTKSTQLIGADFVSWCMLYTYEVTKCICEKMTLYFRGWTIKSHSPGYEIDPINRGRFRILVHVIYVRSNKMHLWENDPVLSWVNH